MNNFTFIGRLTADPEVTETNTTIVAKYSIAVQRDKETADFIRITAFNKTAEFVEKYLTKGVKIAVTGRVQTGRYTDKEGNTHYTTDFIANSHEFCESKSATNEFVPVDNYAPVEDDYKTINDVKEPPIKPQRNTRTTRTTRTRTR